MISDLVILAFGIGMIWYGGQLVALTWGTTLPSLGISGGCDYVPLVAGGVLIVLFSLERIVLRLSGAPIDDALDEMPPAEVAAELDHGQREGLSAMELWILFGVFTLLMLIGTPIAFCLGVASFATVLYMGLPPLVVFQRLNSGMSVFSLLAIPFFIYAGDLMVRGGIAQTDRRLRRLAGRPSARRPRPGQHRHRDAVRRHLRLGGRRSGGRRRADDPADEGARLWRRLCRQRHLDGGADRAAPAALAQHDHLFDLGRRQDLHRRPVHRRHPARPAARRCR